MKSQKFSVYTAEGKFRGTITGVQIAANVIRIDESCCTLPEPGDVVAEKPTKQ